MNDMSERMVACGVARRMRRRRLSIKRPATASSHRCRRATAATKCRLSPFRRSAVGKRHQLAGKQGNRLGSFLGNFDRLYLSTLGVR